MYTPGTLQQLVMKASVYIRYHDTQVGDSWNLPLLVGADRIVLVEEGLVHCRVGG